MDHELFLVFLHALENYWKPWGVRGCFLGGLVASLCAKTFLSILVPENS